jgi:hypothetical protein
MEQIMNTDPDKVLDDDNNGTISVALQVYAKLVQDMNSDEHLP